MLNTSILPKNKYKYYTAAFDIIAVSVIYYLPSISHQISLPLYYFEPMRIILILSMLHTNKSNSYLVALSLPLFSFLFSGHPGPLKLIIISIELFLNAFIYFNLKPNYYSQYLRILLSIIFSKLIYYSLKSILISFLLIKSNLISTPVIFQIITVSIFTIYTFVIYHRKN